MLAVVLAATPTVAAGEPVDDPQVAETPAAVVEASAPVEETPAPVEDAPTVTPEPTTPDPEPEPTTAIPEPSETPIEPAPTPTAEPATPDAGSLGGPMPFGGPVDQQHITWEVRGANGDLVGGARLNVGRRVPPTTSWTTTSGVADCQEEPCTAHDQDPAPGKYLLIGGVGGTPTMDTAQVWQIGLNTATWEFGGETWQWAPGSPSRAMTSVDGWNLDDEGVASYDFGSVVAEGRRQVVLQKSVVQRAAASDQFVLRVLDGVGAQVATANTSGSTVGIQSTKATASRVAPDSPYRISEEMRAGSASTLDAYVTTQACVDDQDAAVDVAPDGSLTTPDRVSFILTCTITNVPSGTTKDVVVRTRTIANPTAVGGTVAGNIGSNTAYTDGARFRLYTAVGATPGQPGDPIDAEWATCTVTAGAGECTITVPTEALGPRYWVIQEEAPDGTYSNPAVRIGPFAAPTNLLRLVGSVSTVTASTAWLPQTNTGVTGGTPLATGDYASPNTPPQVGSFGAIANSLDNPPVELASCDAGLRVALVLDESTSITAAQWTALGDALVGEDDDGGVLGQTLRGTGGKLSILRFSNATRWMLGTSNPVDVAANWSATVTAVRQPTQGGNTNWHDALRSLAPVANRYDLVLFVTDGAPNYILSGVPVGTGGGTADTTLRSLEAPIYAANALKVAGVRVVGVGVGYGHGNNDGQRMDQNLRAISGASYGKDFVHGQWSEVEDLLTAVMRQEACLIPSLAVEKTAATAGPYVAGQAVTWAYTVTNTGWVPVEGITVTDDMGVGVTCPKSSLTKGEQMVCTGTGPLTRSHP